MNVAFDPWIPVVSSSGTRELASLCSVLVEGEKYADLAVRPHERVALMRLFLCVAHAALAGPKNYGEWKEVPRRLPEAVQKYLKIWKDSFELFDKEKPWLQVAKLKPAKDNDEKSFAPVAKLDFSLASGSNSTLFDHQGVKNKFDYPQLTLGLLTIQNFSTCGLLSRPLWNGKSTPDSAKDAPCITSSMYHVFLVGKNMADTIHINICDFDELSVLIESSRPNGDWLGRPVWEQMPNDETDRVSTETFLGRLTPLSRAVHLFEDGAKMLYGEALRYATYPDFPQEFNTSVVIKRTKNKEARYLVGAKLNVRPWRQLDAILQYNLTSVTPSHALNLNHLEGEQFDIWVGALIRNPGKQDVLDSVESRFSISRQFRTAIGCAAYAYEVQKAQGVSKLLETAVFIYRTALDPMDNTRPGSAAITYYWTTVEKNLPLLLSHINAIGTDDSDDSESKRKAWRASLYNAAREAYQIACGQETPRQMRAFAKGWEKLTMTTDKPNTDQNKEEEV
ncbi:MAG: type I-E CRISPR-associated protein Cse1/CasA [Nitrospirae bacterium]|nr:type I-E CRISPR-associated protein Cse1/CasA [Nitrospirota bacterium]